MPPHLHPRSTATSTLFAGTLLASFVVVGIPHVFPCPRPRRQYLDAEGNILQTDAEGRLIVPPPQRADSEKTRQEPDEAAILKMLQEEAKHLEKQEQLARECPVPKPSGWFGKVLGFDGARSPEGQQSTKT